MPLAHTVELVIRAPDFKIFAGPCGLESPGGQPQLQRRLRDGLKTIAGSGDPLVERSGICPFHRAVSSAKSYGRKQFCKFLILFSTAAGGKLTADKLL
jgi:hypothetical protein